MANPRPLRDNVWLLFASGDRDVGGVLSPQDRPDKWMDATVVAAGPGVSASAGFGVGDVVVANLFDGAPVDFEGRIYRCVPASKVMAVLEPEGRKETDMATKKCGKGCTSVKNVSKGKVKRQRLDSTGKKGK